MRAPCCIIALLGGRGTASGKMNQNKMRARVVPSTVNIYGLQIIPKTLISDRLSSPSKQQSEYRVNKDQQAGSKVPESQLFYGRCATTDGQLLIRETQHQPYKLDGRLSRGKVRVPATAFVADLSVPAHHTLLHRPTEAHSTFAVFPDNRLAQGPGSTSRHGAQRAGSAKANSSQASMPYLPGDRVIFTESSTAPGIPIVYRTVEERAYNPERLNLDSRGLTMCPILDGEEDLRLLSLQHNLIRRAQHLSHLRRLVFLDLYANELEEISGLYNLRSLRVLMLGKNRIRKITSLESLAKLDVLDLHGNQILRIENLSHLSELRVLNLAGNQITHVGSLRGLHSLAELNLRRNNISSMKEVDCLPSLQRLFLSYNNIANFDGIVCLREAPSLCEVALDGNPLAQEACYRQTALRHMGQLRQLDMKRVTEEERRLASLLARKQEEKKREFHKQAIQKEKRRLALRNVARHWEQQQQQQQQQQQHTPTWTWTSQSLDVSSGQTALSSSTSAEQLSSQQWPEDSSLLSGASSRESLSAGDARLPTGEEEPTGSKLQSFASSPVDSCTDTRPLPADGLADSLRLLSLTEEHLAEMEGDTLRLFGRGALEALDRSWGAQAAATVTAVSFSYVDFDEVASVLGKLRTRFPGTAHLQFTETNLQNLQQLNALAQLRRIEQLTVNPAGNSLTALSLWTAYATFRLHHLGLRRINGQEISATDVTAAEAMFGSLARLTAPRASTSALGDGRRKPAAAAATAAAACTAESKGKRASGGAVADDGRERGPAPVDSASLAGLQFYSQEALARMCQEQEEKGRFCQDYVKELVDRVVLQEKKLEALQTIWPQFFLEMVTDAVLETQDSDTYVSRRMKELTEE